MDPRKPIKFLQADKAGHLKSVVHAALLEATEHGCRKLGCSGASFVTTSMGLWALEIEEIDPIAASRFLHALAVLVDPKSNDGKKRMAEMRRRAAVQKILHSVDLQLALDGKAKH